MDNLFVILIILLAIPITGLAVAGIIIYRHRHSSRPIEFHSKVPLAEVISKIQPSIAQNPEGLFPEVPPSPIVKESLPLSNLEQPLEEGEEITPLYEAEVSHESPPSTINDSDSDAVLPEVATTLTVESLSSLNISEESLAKDEETTPLYPETGELLPNRLDISDNAMHSIETHSQISAPNVESIPSLPPSKTKRMPVARGGRPRGGLQAEETKHQKTPEKKPRILKPEVICWHEMRKWLVGLEAPEELQDIGLLVAQDDSPLTQDDKGRWQLKKADGKVSISRGEVEQPVEIDLNDKPYLLFRLAGQNICRGRLVHYATIGQFLVIVPDQWQRDEELSEPASILPVGVFLAGYQAHYFSLDQANDQKIAFRTSDGKPVIIPTGGPRFELVGTRLPDATENIGPLFGDRPPRIRASDPDVWSDVGTIVLGQEGSGRGRWRKDFIPEQDQIEQEFPKELYELHSGWYFVRFYDIDNNLTESLDFRFVSALKDIRISSQSALPGIGGYLPARIEFLHNKGCAVELDDSAKNLSVEYEDGRTSVTIPSDPAWDETRWVIHSDDGAQVEAKILVERVWWAIGEEGLEEMSIKWTDTPLNISRDIVTATSKQTLHFRLPRPRWVKEIRAGFEQWKARAYPVEVAKRDVIVPLSHFEGAQEIEDRAHEHTLKLWIKGDAHYDTAAVVVVFPAVYPLVRRARADIRRMRNYLRRLKRKTQDLTLRQIINEAREKWSPSAPKADTSFYRIEAGCVIALTWEILKRDETKPPGRRKRWIKELVRLADAHPDTMQGVRENYEALKHSPASASSRRKQ